MNSHWHPCLYRRRGRQVVLISMTTLCPFVGSRQAQPLRLCPNKEVLVNVNAKGHRLNCFSFYCKHLMGIWRYYLLSFLLAYYYGKKKKRKIGRPPGGHSNLENGPMKMGKRRKKRRVNLMVRKKSSCVGVAPQIQVGRALPYIWHDQNTTHSKPMGGYFSVLNFCHVIHNKKGTVFI